VASIKKRPNGRWRARYRGPDGRERAKDFGRRVDAEQFLHSTEADKVRGAWVDPALGRSTFGSYARTWQEAQVHRPATVALVESHLRKHVRPFFEDRAIASIRPSEIQAWIKGRAEVLAPSTVEVVYRFVAAIFRAAVADRIISVSPCQGAKLPKRERRQVTPLETEQVHALTEAVGERHRPLVIVAAGTGLRQGEIFGLTIPHVDFLRRELRVDQQLVTVAGRPPFLAPPKTEASRRTVPLPDVVIAALAAHLQAFPAGDLGLVFTNQAGEPLRRSRFGDTVWRPAVRGAGLPPGTGLHDLRHYYASLLIRHGESVKVVQARLGHASAAETLDTYSHLWPDSEDRTRRPIDSVLGAPADFSRTGGGP
jgi:integrase